ncbi:MAG TPA: hypothetical protein VFV10_21215 [Gammaproteobacteria bacterium]|nr:hypothetical protein [Gammaproteobacteria bacterium]
MAWSDGRNREAVAYHEEAVAICERLGLTDLVAVQAYHGRGPTEAPTAPIIASVRAVARYAWAAPCTAVGLVLGAAVVLRGGTARLRSGVLEVAAAERARAPRFPFAAITFGHVVVARSERALEESLAHELEHVRQYERWGLAFFVAYPASSLYQLLRGRHPYWRNRFEVEARKRAHRS